MASIFPSALISARASTGAHRTASRGETVLPLIPTMVEWVLPRSSSAASPSATPLPATGGIVANCGEAQDIVRSHAVMSENATWNPSCEKLSRLLGFTKL
eukprot:6182420-Pleurochrysis_carterae.AAC.3